MKTTVVHCRKEPFDVYIGRPTAAFPQGSVYANPFRIGPDGSREEVIRKFREWLPTQPGLLARVEELRGKRIGCWCRLSTAKKGLPCHGDVYVELLEGKEVETGQLDLF